MNKLLVVEDEVITSDLLRRYFEMVGYEVVSALTGASAIEMALEQQPEVIILDIMLPDMDGYEICRRLRSEERTRLIPIIFLTQKDERRDRLDGLSLGADDYVTKPFDVEELRLRVHNIIIRMGGTPLVDPRTSLPNMTLIKERLPGILGNPDNVFVDVQIDHFAAFSEKYGPVSANQVIRSAAKMIGDLLHQVDPSGSFIGHPRDDHFLIGLKQEAATKVEQELPTRFRKHIERFYDPAEVARGHMTHNSQEIPLMQFRLVRIPPEALRSLVALPEDVKIAAASRPEAAAAPAGEQPTAASTASPAAPAAAAEPPRPETAAGGPAAGGPAAE